jgi:hypothetical protein
MAEPGRHPADTDRDKVARDASEQTAQTQHHGANSRPDNPAMDAAIADVTDQDDHIPDETEADDYLRRPPRSS